MIKKIEIQNFQGHKNTELTLHPGVNVVKGPSHSGKSSIVRALKWALRNRPSGFSFKSTFASDKDPTFVHIRFDNSSIERYRSKDDNKYGAAKKGSLFNLAAMKTEVPDEVREITQMNDINIQSQHDGYFLLQDSAGEVGKKLNNIVGLGIINDVMDRIRSKISSTQANIKNEIVVNKELTETLKKYDGIDQIAQLVTGLGCLLDTKENNENKQREIKQLVSSIETNTDELTEVNKWLEIERETTELSEWFDTLKEITKRKNILEGLCVSIKRDQQGLIETTSWLSVEKETNELDELTAKVLELSTTKIHLFTIIQEIKRGKETIRMKAVELSEDTKDFNDLMKKEGVCPLCGKKMC